MQEFQKTKVLKDEKTELDAAVNHARTIVKLKPEVDEIVREIFALPASTEVEELMKLCNSYYNQYMIVNAAHAIGDVAGSFSGIDVFFRKEFIFRASRALSPTKCSGVKKREFSTLNGKFFLACL